MPNCNSVLHQKKLIMTKRSFVLEDKKKKTKKENQKKKKRVRQSLLSSHLFGGVISTSQRALKLAPPSPAKERVWRWCGGGKKMEILPALRPKNPFYRTLGWFGCFLIPRCFVSGELLIWISNIWLIGTKSRILCKYFWGEPKYTLSNYFYLRFFLNFKGNLKM